MEFERLFALFGRPTYDNNQNQRTATSPSATADYNGSGNSGSGISSNNAPTRQPPPLAPLAPLLSPPFAMRLDGPCYWCAVTKVSTQSGGGNTVCCCC